MRELSYAEAIREAHAELFDADSRVFLIGGGVRSPWYAGASLKDIDKDFGPERIIDTPLSENAVTGAAIGAAIAGMRPILFHARLDFMLLAFDPIVNQASNWSYLFSGKSSVPLVIRAVINRGGQQGAQHSQAAHAVFMHIPGIKVVMPSTPHDAKGLLVAAVEDGNPVLYLDERWLYEQRGTVPSGLYRVPLGSAAVRRKGTGVTIVGLSYMASEACKAAEKLALHGIDAEVIDLRTAKPWDKDLVLSSVRKTGRLIIADSGWHTCGAAAEIAATAASEVFDDLEAPVERVTLPDVPAPVSVPEEKSYYIGWEQIVSAARRALRHRYHEATA
ncbi:MAG: alpha-ketoacid dehydrogenase subunit beta [Acidobacteria bacterium]|nr:alpha-ketoacid dehydrogenase subunit beta [Acidobacteriota bacterium]